MLTLGLLAALVATTALAEPAVGPDRPLADAAQEARARELFTDIRCVVCQHEAIADSPAAIAADIRALVREQIAEGQSDEAIRRDLVRRYGDYVLFTPPFRWGTLVLWLGPFLLAIGAGTALFMRARRRKPEGAALDEREEAELDAWIKADDESGQA
ncbi:hypothetical protein OB03_14265 [Brevundimonas sp. GN22]